MNESEMMQNARRLAGALYRHADAQTVDRLARILDYMPEQLAADIQSLAEVIDNAPERDAE